MIGSLVQLLFTKQNDAPLGAAVSIVMMLRDRPAGRDLPARDQLRQDPQEGSTDEGPVRSAAGLCAGLHGVPLRAHVADAAVFLQRIRPLRPFRSRGSPPATTSTWPQTPRCWTHLQQLAHGRPRRVDPRDGHRGAGLACAHALPRAGGRADPVVHDAAARRAVHRACRGASRHHPALPRLASVALDGRGRPPDGLHSLCHDRADVAPRRIRPFARRGLGRSGRKRLEHLSPRSPCRLPRPA